MMIITHVAHLFDNKVISLPAPYRHHHLFQMKKDHPDLPRWNVSTGTPEVQGFLTSTGMFVDRYDALELFLAYKQKECDELRGMLFSENCWKTPGNWQAPVGDPERTLYDHNNSRDTMKKLLRIEPFIGSTAPYRIETVTADIFYREGVVVVTKNTDFRARIAKTLYSQMYEEPMTDPLAQLERIYHYFSNLLPSSMEIDYVRRPFAGSSDQ